MRRAGLIGRVAQLNVGGMVERPEGLRWRRVVAASGPRAAPLRERLVNGRMPRRAVLAPAATVPSEAASAEAV